MKPIATLISMLALLLGGCGDSHPRGDAPQDKQAVRVESATVEAQQWPRLVEGVGTVEARTESVISARAMGYVQAVRVREGDRVSAGQTLVEISAQEIQAGVDQAKAVRQEARSAQAEVDSAITAAEAQASLARATHQRMKNLHERKSLSDQEFDEATARLQATEANLRMAQARKLQVADKIAQASAGLSAAESQLSYLRIAAPFAGVVTERMAEPGSLASPGMPLVKLEQMGNYRLNAAFPESVLGQIKVGQKVAVEIAAIGMNTEGTVAELVPIVDPQTRTFSAKITLPATAMLRSGLFGVARLRGESAAALTVPSSAVRTNGQLSTVLVAENGKARSRMVKLGEEREGQREVLAGLAAGERLIMSPPVTLQDGDPVEAGQ
ncbi:MAG: efflux RND transporter periplasmic adaptor subunit [Bryobacterales bacterium]|nr:efflux RND transporter periplasmic adaptor subunit [Bryobacterales bacterium]